jgi:hypothetical protein
MKARSPQSALAWAIAIGVAGALAIGCASALAAPTRPSSKQAQPALSGTWSGRYGGAASGTFTLRWKQSGSTLRGTIKLSNPPGTFPISGKLRGNTISFGAVGVGATYTGTVSGKSMSGRWKSANRGGTWSARKTS